MSRLRFTREQLLEALEARRPWAERYDADNLKTHQRAEKEALAAFRAKCREAAKWTYSQAVEAGRYSLSLERPHCPASAVALLERNLTYVKTSGQKTYMVTERGDWSRLFWVLTHDETIKSDVCS